MNSVIFFAKLEEPKMNQVQKLQKQGVYQVSVGYEGRIRNLAIELGLDWNKFVLIPETGMYVGVVDITPTMADAFLERNINNRNKKERSIEGYANDMVKRFWKLTHEGIAFGIDGLLKDGQNRLYAIIRSNTIIRMKVTLGLDNEAQAVIDQGVKRTSSDAAKFEGVETTWRRNATAKVIENGKLNQGGTSPITNSQCLELLEKYKEGLDFVFDNMPKNLTGITKAPVLGAIGRAYFAYRFNIQAIERLKLFCKILSDGQYGEDYNLAAHTLRERLLGVRGRKAPGYGHAGSQEAYGLTESCIVAFLEKRAYQKVCAAKEELFPFPHEMDSIAMVARKLRERQQKEV
jgi:hypothetical protein